MKSRLLTKYKIFIVIFLTILIQLQSGLVFNTLAETDKAQLQTQIESRGEELKKINQQILEQQQKLNETQAQKQTLTTEVKKIDSEIKQIDLGIQSSKIAVEKMNLEISSLQEDIEVSEQDIAQKESTLGQILRELQQKDQETVLIMVLKNKTLSEGVLEVQTLTDMNSKMLSGIDELNKAKENLNNILDKTSRTKTQKEIENENLKSKKYIASDLKEEKSKFLNETKNKEKIYQESLKELEKKQLEIALEIEKMESDLRQQINYKNLPKNLPGFLSIPVSGPITQDYGATKFAQKAYKGKWHNGLDFGAPIGTPVYASNDGTVVSVENQDKYCYRGAYGKYVAIKHYMGLTTIYAHLSLYIVAEGDQVKRGQIIGYVGKTGYATGPHLHFTVYDSSTFKIGPSNTCGPKMPYGGDLNPRNYLAI